MLIKLVILLLCQIFYLNLYPKLKLHHKLVSSLGGGMAVAYVFVVLFPEINEGVNHIGNSTYIFVLVGFVVYHLIEWLNQKHRNKNNDKGHFQLELSALLFYNALIVFATPPEVLEETLALIVLSLVMALHLTHANYMLHIKHPEHFERRTLLFLICALLVGFVAHQLHLDSSESVKDYSIAFLSGSLIYNAFKHELPKHEESNYGWFVTGIALMAMVAFIVE